MSAQENKAVVERVMEEVFNKGHLDIADELIAADCIDHNPFPGQVSGVEGVKQGAVMFRSAFPDLHFANDDIIAEGDKVVHRYRIRGTHQGEFFGIPPTGKQVTVTGIDILRIAGGKIVERWSNTDDLGMMQQLGVVPASGQGES